MCSLPPCTSAVGGGHVGSGEVCLWVLSNQKTPLGSKAREKERRTADRGTWVTSGNPGAQRWWRGHPQLATLCSQRQTVPQAGHMATEQMSGLSPGPGYVQQSKHQFRGPRGLLPVHIPCSPLLSPGGEGAQGEGAGNAGTRERGLMMSHGQAVLSLTLRLCRGNARGALFLYEGPGPGCTEEEGKQSSGLCSTKRQKCGTVCWLPGAAEPPDRP